MISGVPATRTVREFGGEIWAELMSDMRVRANSGSDFYAGFSVEAQDAVIELIMGVLARYIGAPIVNDEDMSVAPLVLS